MAAALAGSPLSAQPDSPARSSGGGAATPPSAKSRLGGVLSPFRRALGSNGGGSGGGSPLGSSSGAGAAAAQQPQSSPAAARSLLPSYGHAVAKRETIRAQEEQLAALRLRLGQLEEETARLRSELASERGAREALQERLNLQFFKASLLVDMFVAQLLEGNKQAAAAAAAGQGCNGEAVF